MKKSIKILLFVLATVMMFALASCGDNGEDSSSKTPGGDSSSQQSGQTYTVTFRYGVKSYDVETGTVTEYANEKVVTYQPGKSVTPPTNSEVKTKGYKNEGWDSKAYQKAITKDLVISQLYSPLSAHTVTFTNAIGNVIKTVQIYDGDKLQPEDKPSTAVQVVVITADKYNNLFAEEQEAYTLIELEGVTEAYYCQTADLVKLQNGAIAIPQGSYFESWVSDEGSTGIQIKADITFTVSLGSADSVVPKVPTGAITIDGKFDMHEVTVGEDPQTGNPIKGSVSYYEKVGGLFKHPISMSGIADTSASTLETKFDSKKFEGISDLINAYATKEEAELNNPDDKTIGDRWQAQYDNYHLGGDIDGELYMCWDGDYIYFLVKVYDSKVCTEGQTYCSGFNPYENDTVEIWYTVGENFDYYKLSIDAAGYSIFGGGERTTSKYLNYLKDNGMYKTTVYTDVDDPQTIVDLSTSTAPRVLAEGNNAGYIVEYAIPAYQDPDELSEVTPENKLGGTGWGEKLGMGDILLFSLQVNTISAPIPNTPAAIAGEYAVSTDPSQNGAVVSNIKNWLKENDQTTWAIHNRWCAGFQFDFAEGVGGVQKLPALTYNVIEDGETIEVTKPVFVTLVLG